MGFLAESTTIGEHDTLFAGVPLHTSALGDRRLTILGDLGLVIPSGLLGFCHQKMVEAVSWRANCNDLASKLIGASHVAKALVNIDWKRVDRNRFPEIVAGANIVLNPLEIRDIWNMLNSAQLGDNFVPQWSSMQLYALPNFTEILSSLKYTHPGSRDGDITGLTELAFNKLYMSIITRWPRIASGFSSLSTPAGDMERRASVLFRLAGLFMVLKHTSTYVKALVLHALWTHPMFQSAITARANPNLLPRTESRLANYALLDTGNWKLFITAQLKAVSGDHLNRKVEINRLPVGFWRTIVDKLGAHPKHSATPIGFHYTVDATDISGQTTIHPLLQPVGTITPEEWEKFTTDEEPKIYNELDKVLTALEGDSDLQYLLRDKSAIEQFRAHLNPLPILENVHIPSSGHQLIPILVSTRVASDPLKTMADLSETAIINEQTATIDARDIARFVRTRATTLRQRIQRLTKDTGEGLHAIFFAPIDPMHSRWPSRTPLKLMEMLPLAYLGRASNGLTRPATLEGFADINETSVARFHEAMNVAFEEEGMTLTKGGAIYALSRIGLVTEHEKAPSEAEKLEDLKLLKAPKAFTLEGRLLSPGKTSATGMKGHLAFSSTYIWGVDAADNLNMLLADTEGAIPLTTDGKWLLWPYSRVPVPGSITADTITTVPIPDIGNMGNLFPRYHNGEAVGRLPLQLRAHPGNGDNGGKRTWLPSLGFARLPGIDGRSYFPFSWPAGCYEGYPFVLASVKTPLGGGLRFLPMRVDVADVTLWTTDELITAPQAIELISAPGATAQTVPPTTFHDYGALLAAKFLEL